MTTSGLSQWQCSGVAFAHPVASHTFFISIIRLIFILSNEQVLYIFCVLYCFLQGEW